MPRRISVWIPVVLIGCALTAYAQAPSQPAKPLATQELDVEGVVAEVIESVRKGDMLTVRVRFRNVGTAPAKISLAGGAMSYHTANYIVAGDTRYDIMRDTDGKVLATPRDGGGWLEPTIRPKATFGWWANYQAPPPAQKTYTLYLKVGPPIQDVPIIDK